MSLSPRVRFPSAAVLILLLGCGGEAPPSRPAPPQPSPAAASPAPEPPAPVSAVTDPFGYYLLEDSGALPAWARSIDHLHLSKVDLRDGEMVTVPLWGHLRMKEEREAATSAWRRSGWRGRRSPSRRRRSTASPTPSRGTSWFPGSCRPRRRKASCCEAVSAGWTKAGRAGELDARFLYTPGD